MYVRTAYSTQRPLLFVLLPLLAALCATPASAQQASGERIYQLSGIILNEDNGQPIPFVRVSVNNTRRMTVANHEGFFSIPVVPTDTLFFYSLGHRSARLIVADFLRAYQGDTSTYTLYAIQYLKETDVQIDSVNVFPWNTPEELRLAILNMPRPANDPNSLANANVDPALLAYLAESLPVDEGERQSAALQRYYMEYAQRYQRGNVTFFDPFAVYRLVDYISQKNRQKKEKVYNYWPDEQ